MLIDDDRMSNARALLSSLNMLLWTSAGFGYTGTDCISWMRAARFGDVRIAELAGGNSMVVGSKSMLQFAMIELARQSEGRGRRVGSQAPAGRSSRLPNQRAN